MKSLFWTLPLAWCLLVGCTSSPTQVTVRGGGTETVGIYGTVIDTTGHPSVGTVVKIRPAGYLDTSGASLSKLAIYLADDITDSAGHFNFSNIASGAYRIEAVATNLGATVQCTLAMYDSSLNLSQITLAPTVPLTGHIPDHEQIDSSNVSVYIYGLDRCVTTDDSGNFVITGVPPGKYDFRFVAHGSLYGAFDSSGIRIDSGTPAALGTIALPQRQIQMHSADSTIIRELLDSNGLTSISVKAVCLANPLTQRIEILRLSMLGISKLTRGVGQLSELKELRADNNLLTSLPSEIGQLRTLRSIHIQNNKITQLPPSIGLLDSLRELAVSNNRLNSLPAQLSTCKRLLLLDVSSNLLATLPDEIGNCTSINTLVLVNNRLTTLPNSLNTLVNLRYLLLQSNLLTSLPDSIISWHPDFLFVSVAYNKLCGISEEAQLWIDRYTNTGYPQPQGSGHQGIQTGILGWRETQNCN